MKDESIVPGEFQCPQCGFVITKSILNPSIGACSRDTADRLEPCPNDGTILRPVKYADALAEARIEACRLAAIVNKMPRTADGVTIVPGATVYASGGLELVVWAVRQSAPTGRPPQGYDVMVHLPGGLAAGKEQACHLFNDQIKAVAHKEDLALRAKEQ